MVLLLRAEPGEWSVLGAFQGQARVGERGKHNVEVNLIPLSLVLVLLGSNKQWLQDMSNLPRWSFNPDV